MPQPEPTAARAAQFGSAVTSIVTAHNEGVRKIIADRPASSPPPSKADVLLGLISLRETVSFILLLIVSGSTVLLTFAGVLDGLAETGTSFMRQIEAGYTAIAIGVLSGLGWFFLFGLVDKLHGRYLAGGATAGFLFILLIAAIDASYNMVGLAGGTASQLSMLKTAEVYQDQVAAAFARMDATRGIQPAINAQDKRFGGLEKLEIEKGVMSGGGKPGKVSAMFNQIATPLGELSKELSQGLAKADALQTEATRLLAEMKTEVFKEGPVRARMEAVSTRADQLDAVLRRMSQLDFTVSIRATLKTLDGLPVPKTAKTAFEKNQNEQIALIAEMARPVVAALTEGLDALNAAPRAALKSMRPEAPMQAIKTYWRELISQWALATALTLSPGLLLLILIAARREAESLNKGAKS